MRTLLLALLLFAPAFAQDSVTPLDYVDKKAIPHLTDKRLVKFTTDKGSFTAEIYPQAAPNAARRFLDLLAIGFFDNTPVFRVVPGFVVQFGINWRGDFPQWQDKPFKDDPSLFKLDRGTLAFAKAGPDTNSTQMFINLGDNSQLATKGGFTTFGKVIEGMDVVDQFNPVGDPRMGLDQEKLWKDGDTYLKSLPAQPAKILKVELVK